MRLLSCTIALTSLAALAAAAEPTGPAARADRLASFIDDQTFAIGWTDAKRLDVDALQAMLLTTLKALDGDSPGDVAADELAVAMADTRTWLAHFQKAGGKDLYAVASLADLVDIEGPFVVAPLDPNADAQAIAALLFSGKPDGPTTRPADERQPGGSPRIVERLGSAIVLAAPRTIERLRVLKPTPRPEITRALETAGQADAAIVIAPTADCRRVVEEMIPTLPPALGGGPITTVTHGFMWVALAVDMKPTMTVRGTIQSQDAETAQALAGVVNEALKAASENRELQRNIPGLDRILGAFKPDVRGDRLTLRFEADAAARLVIPSIRQARFLAKRTVSLANMSGIMAAIYAYSGNHKNQWPEDLAALVKESYITEGALVNPCRPWRKPGYIYIRPAQPSAVDPKQVVLYEAYDGWGEGINVGYGDAHAEFVADEAQFKKMLAEALSKGTATSPGATRPAASPATAPPSEESPPAK